LLLFRIALDDSWDKTNTVDESFLTSAITTPLGQVKGIRPSQLELIQMPYITESGGVGHVPVKRLYLDQILDKLAIDLGIDRTALIDGSRKIVMVGNVDFSSHQEIYPCYYRSTANTVNMANLQRLEANVMRRIDERLEYLPSDLLSEWKNTALTPIFE
jgi:hypothetical protein